MHILIVEDDRWLAECYRQWLHRAGHETTWRTTAQDAIDAVDGQLPDVVLLDILLPTANGIQLLQEFRTHADLQQIPFILCSSVLPRPLPDLSAYNVVRMLDKAEITPSLLRSAVQRAREDAVF